MPHECPYCRRSVDPRATVCPYCTSDVSYQRPATPVEMMRDSQAKAEGLSWHLWGRLILLVPFSLLTGLPLLPVIVIAGAIYLVSNAIIETIKSGIASAESQRHSGPGAGEGSQGNGHE